MDLELHLNGIEAHIEPAAVEGMSEQPAVPIAIPYLELRTAGRGDHEVKVLVPLSCPEGPLGVVCVCARARVSVDVWAVHAAHVRAFVWVVWREVRRGGLGGGSGMRELTLGATTRGSAQISAIGPPALVATRSATAHAEAVQVLLDSGSSGIYAVIDGTKQKMVLPLAAEMTLHRHLNDGAGVSLYKGFAVECKRLNTSFDPAQKEVIKAVVSRILGREVNFSKDSVKSRMLFVTKEKLAAAEAVQSALQAGSGSAEEQLAALKVASAHLLELLQLQRGTTPSDSADAQAR